MLPGARLFYWMERVLTSSLHSQQAAPFRRKVGLRKLPLAVYDYVRLEPIDNTIFKDPPWRWVFKDGAGGESRTHVASLENWNINRYTTPARGMFRL